jgi:hypothetical protein
MGAGPFNCCDENLSAFCYLNWLKSIAEMLIVHAKLWFFFAWNV